MWKKVWLKHLNSAKTQKSIKNVPKTLKFYKFWIFWNFSVFRLKKISVIRTFLNKNIIFSFSIKFYTISSVKLLLFLSDMAVNRLKHLKLEFYKFGVLRIFFCSKMHVSFLRVFVIVFLGNFFLGVLASNFSVLDIDLSPYSGSRILIVIIYEILFKKN